MIDDRDVAGLKAPGQVLGAPVDPGEPDQPGRSADPFPSLPANRRE